MSPLLPRIAAFLLAISLGNTASTCCCATTSHSDAPNLILVVTDDQGIGDLSLNGNPNLATPAIDAFAAQGIALSRFYVSPVCAPTRASLMTGRYAYRTGVAHTSRGGALMRGSELTVAERLAELGYRTGIFGKWHLGDNLPMRPQDQGFQHSLVHKSGGIGQAPDTNNPYQNPKLYADGHPIQMRGYCTDLFFDAAIRFLQDKPDQPCFIYLPTNTPHSPFEVDDRYSQPFLDRGLDERTAKVYGMIVNLDENFARLDRALTKSGQNDNTMVIFMTDNGANGSRFNAGFRGHKASVYEGGIRVPFFARWPKHLPAGKQLNFPAAHIDLFPTLVSAAGGDLRSTKVDGRNLMPLFRGQQTVEPRDLFIQCHRGNAPVRNQNVAMIDGNWKLLISPGTFDEWTMVPDDPPAVELYDLLADPDESIDLSARHPQKVASMRMRYERWFADVAENFAPGRIRIGDRSEPVQRLCAYQDSQWTHGKAPSGWLVDVVRGGLYQITTAPPIGIDEVQVLWNGTALSTRLNGESTLLVRLPKAKAKLQVIRKKHAAGLNPSSTHFDLSLGIVDADVDAD